MGQILGDSFDIVAAIRLLERRLEALEQRLDETAEEEPARQAKLARPPKAKSETLEVSV